jgi:phosphopantetheine adenylyltransferase
MLTTRITEQGRQQEWDTICTIARSYGFPLQVVRNLENKLIFNIKNKQYTHTYTKNEMDHIYVSQSTHTQTYQPVQKYRLKHSFSNV